MGAWEGKKGLRQTESVIEIMEHAFTNANPRFWEDLSAPSGLQGAGGGNQFCGVRPSKRAGVRDASSWRLLPSKN